ncbi:Stp1/IreP family PP2C-type Ser/Thr phosphatase [Xylanibacillus composti]|uniref:protein-serine/threonine phosphatase n=1 Tax=Xylanibacillus composti TaxID=1572762 RepID=A0A8J4H1H2_9BACL|nr:Stp1/IreP family PP2C-type Ser/Thr phosphatase [Xylanibacillus composti]MDT9725599.1 Stp1/IreP family PP2C-type Ser/Thr phosphatase [Xylanibacillus composti]GIQ67692.1 protein phosphatase [Xylanibacillus composti]
MKAVNKTDVGKVRQINEDSSWVNTDWNGLTLAIVADGMGGHKAGDVASQMAISVLQEQLLEISRDTSTEQCEDFLRTAIHAANHKLYELASSNPAYSGMGTTIAVVLANSEWLLAAHIGDSRIYLCTEQAVLQLTEDHSLVNELVKSGQITAEEAATHPRRNILTKAMGTDPFVDPDVRLHDWKAGDLLLICSDGLTSMVGEDRISEFVRNTDSLEQKADRLVESALEAGGDDNVTVVLLANEAMEGGASA